MTSKRRTLKQAAKGVAAWMGLLCVTVLALFVCLFAYLIFANPVGQAIWAFVFLGAVAISVLAFVAYCLRRAFGFLWEPLATVAYVAWEATTRRTSPPPDYSD